MPNPAVRIDERLVALERRMEEMEAAMKTIKESQPQSVAFQVEAAEPLEPETLVDTSGTENENERQIDKSFTKEATARLRKSVLKKTQDSGFIDVFHTQDLSPSLWDSTSIVGLQQVGTVGSITLSVGLVVAIVLQCLFTYVVAISFLSKDEKYERDQVADWRFMYGHNSLHMDVTSGASLVSKVCNGLLFDRLFWQQELLTETQLFLRPMDAADEEPVTNGGLVVGTCLCSISILIWTAYIAKEVQSSLNIILAMLKLPLSDKTQILPGESEHGYRIGSLTRHRKYLMIAVNTLRIGIALALGFIGGEWLAITMKVEDIVLNAAALLFVLEIDELLFEIIAPQTIKVFLDAIEPVECGASKYWLGLDPAGLGRVIALTGVLVYFGFKAIENQQAAVDIRNTLCDGNLDFVYGTTDMGHVMLASTQPYSAASDIYPAGVRSVLREVVDSAQSATKPFREGQQGLFDVDLQGKGPAVVYVAQNAETLNSQLGQDLDAWLKPVGFGTPMGLANVCKDTNTPDMPPEEAPFWEKHKNWTWTALRTRLEDWSLRNCSFVTEDMCERVDVVLSRVLCPETCGCALPLSGLKVMEGCRWYCHEQRLAVKPQQEWYDALATASCQDLSGEDDPRYPAWKQWWKHTLETTLSNWASDNPLVKYARGESFEFPSGSGSNCSMSQGCCILKSGQRYIETDICSDARGRPASMFCPESCQCGSAEYQARWEAEGRLSWCPNCTAHMR